MNALPVFELELPEATPSNNTVKNMHHRVYKKEREKWHKLVMDALGGTLPAAPIELCALEVVRYSAGQLDWDNLHGGLKPLQDCLVMPSKRNPDGLGLIRDDGPKAMPESPRLRQLQAKKGQGRTVVRIYDASNDDKFKNDNND